MKITVVKLKTAVFITLAVWSINSLAQVKTIMYVMKNGTVVFQSPVSGVDNVSFDEAASNDALIVRKNNGSPADNILLNDIQQLSFSGENLSVETLSNSNVYVFSDIAKLLFDDITAQGINNPPAQSDFDVLVYVTAAGDVIVQSLVAIKSLALFGIDGRMISVERCNAAAVGALCTTSLQNAPAGIYLLRVETEQGTVVKKVVKPANK